MLLLAASTAHDLVQKRRFNVFDLDGRGMHGTFAGQMQARVERCDNVRFALIAKHHRCRTTRLAVYGNAHLLAIAAIRCRTVDKVDRHHN